MSDVQPIDLDDLHRVGVKIRELTDDNWLADMVEIACDEIARLREERHNGTELGHLLRSAQVTIPRELTPLDPQCRKYAAGWNDCLHNVKAMLAGKITVNQQTGTIKVRSYDKAAAWIEAQEKRR